jgi:hypothetical protein
MYGFCASNHWLGCTSKCGSISISQAHRPGSLEDIEDSQVMAMVAKCVYQLVHHCHCSKILLFIIWLEVSTCFLFSMNWTWWQVGLKPLFFSNQHMGFSHGFHGCVFPSTFLDSRIRTTGMGLGMDPWLVMSGIHMGVSCHKINVYYRHTHSSIHSILWGCFILHPYIAYLCLQLISQVISIIQLYLKWFSDIYIYYLWGCWFTPSFFV